MTEAIRFLTSLAQALAKMSLYADGHPTRGRAADASFAQLRELQKVDARPRFSFLGRSVVYGERAIRELADWDWSAKLSAAGIQRIEFPESVDAEEYRRFLEDILTRIALMGGAGHMLSEADQAQGSTQPIRFGAIGVRASQERSDSIEEVEPPEPTLALDLTEEADVVMWMHDEVASAGRLPLLEAEVVIDSLVNAMHQQANAFVPLLTLKEFDQYTTTHALNVAVLAMGLAEHLRLSTREVRAYGVAGLLHDLGKVKVPVEIVQKPGALTPEEQAIMRQHPTDGARLILESDNRLDLSAAVAFEHHIMIDGGGYPTRRTRRDCHHASMLVHVCDVFDALRTHRPYRVAWEVNAVVDYIMQRTGTEFHPDVARAFVAMLRERELREARADAIDGLAIAHSVA
jgi:putative nucleotidyltransferase with HDIG domain